MPLACRFKKIYTELGLDVPTDMTKTCYLGRTPPWLLFSVEYQKLTNLKKPDLIPIEVQTLFIDFLFRNTGHQFIYTDGSKCGEKVGSAVVCNEEIRSYRLPNNTSVYTAEIFAILQALQYTKLHNIKKVIICTDSMSALNAISSGDTSYFVTVICELYDDLRRHNFDINFVWVPSHAGIPGNDLADRHAKNATGKDFITRVLVSPKEHFPRIKRAVRKRFAEMWENVSMQNHLKSIKTVCEAWDTVFREKRRDEIVLTRLRIGHTNITHSYILDKKEKPRCTRCNTYLTVKHILLECANFINHRLALRQICHRHNVDFCLKSLLGNLSGEFGDGVLKFLKDADVYDSI